MNCIMDNGDEAESVRMHPKLLSKAEDDIPLTPSGQDLLKKLSSIPICQWLNRVALLYIKGSVVGHSQLLWGTRDVETSGSKVSCTCGVRKVWIYSNWMDTAQVLGFYVAIILKIQKCIFENFRDLLYLKDILNEPT